MHFPSRRMRRLVAAELAPGAGRAAGQGLGPHLPGRPDAASTGVRRCWRSGLPLRAQWAGHRAAPRPPQRRGGRGAWLDGDAAEAVACDAAMVPSSPATSTSAPWKTWSGSASSSTGSAATGAAAEAWRWTATAPAHAATAPAATVPGRTAPPDPAPAAARKGTGRGLAAAAPDTARAWEALERAIIGKAADLLSGPGGLARFLRRRQPGARLGWLSRCWHRVLPVHPAGIRNAVTLRDQHCHWAGGCHQPASACEVHHVKHKKNGGTTSTKDCVLLCFFHHQIVIHKWGWTLVLNPDGTTTAWNPGKTKILHSHSPPAQPG